MTTENDVGTAAAAAALFHLHSSPLVGPTYNMMKMTLPAFALGQQSTAPGEMREAAFSLKGIGRPRSSSWDPTYSSLSLLNFMNGETDAAGTLCALMKSETDSQVVAEPIKSQRPRSQSTSATLPLSHQQIRAYKGLRPRSTSVSSAAPSQTASIRRSARPRSYSHSSRVSARSTSSNRNSRKRALSFESLASDRLDDLDSDASENGDTGSVDSIERGRLDELHRIGTYSPRSRRKRIDRFLEKRRRRIWRKRIKYDVRKNFADSRLRVKGRFVRKEDEEQLREYLQIT